MKPAKLRFLFCLVPSALCLLMGCHSAKVAQPLTEKLGGNDPDAQMEFWHTLANQPLTSNDEAFHGLLLYLDNQDPAADYPGRVQTLKDRGLLDRGFDQPADQAVQRGTLAQALVRALKIRGGVFQRLGDLGPAFGIFEFAVWSFVWDCPLVAAQQRGFGI